MILNEIRINTNSFHITNLNKKAKKRFLRPASFTCRNKKYGKFVVFFKFDSCFSNSL